MPAFPRMIDHRLCLQSNPGNADDDIHSLLFSTFPLEGPCSVLLVVPESTDSAVHAPASCLLGLSGGADMLDYGAVGNVFVRGCLLFVGRGLLDEGFQDIIL